MKHLFSFLLFLTFFSNIHAQGICGYWKSVDQKTQKTQCVVAVYEYKDKFYGRIIGICDSTGKMDDTIYAPKRLAKGIAGSPYYSGLDLIWDLSDRDGYYKGKVVDPEGGSIYAAEVWEEKGNLIIRGKLMFFGRSVAWPPATERDFPKGFKKPDVTKFVPNIPEVK
jgi:uncharacterized protein (DUF2147 family)